MGSTPLGGCIGYFLKFLFSNFRSHIKDSKWGRKCISINCTSCNRSPQQIPLQIGNCPIPVAEHSWLCLFLASMKIIAKGSYNVSWSWLSEFIFKSELSGWGMSYKVLF